MKIAILIFLVFFHSSLFAQNQLTPDNVEEKLTDLKGQINFESLSIEDFDVIMDIREIYYNLNLDSALYYSSIEVKLAQNTENPNTLANSRLVKATLLWKLQQADLAHALLIKNIANKDVVADTTLAKSLFRIAKVEIQKFLVAESFEHAITASEIYIELEDSISASNCFAHIAGIQVFARDDAEASIPYFKKALAYIGNNKNGNTIRLLINYSSALVGLGRFPEALNVIRDAERIFKQNNHPGFEPSIYIQYGLVYNASKDYDKSLKYCLLADSVLNSRPVMDLNTQGKVYKFLALNYKELKMYDEAIFYFKSLENSIYLDPWMINSHLIQVYKEIGDFEQAFLLQESLIAAKDSSYDDTRDKKLLEVIEKYENEKKQQEIVRLSAEKELQNNQIQTQQFVIYGTICFFLALLVFGVFWYSTRTKLRETTLNLETTKLQQRFLRTQLNPHFFFHALTSIESFIYKNDKMKSAGFLRNFSMLMRNILESSDVDFITLRQDIDFIKRYIELQQLNHEFKFDYEIIVSPELNVDELKIPPMLIQPAVENAILHGALSKENGRVDINYSKENDQLQISISDNGESDDVKHSLSNRLNRSMSLGITESRIKNFKEVHGVTISYSPFNLGDKAENSLVTFSMPLEL